MAYSVILFAASLFLFSLNFNESEAVDFLQISKQQSCNISDLHLAERKSVVSCFQEDIRTNTVLKQNTECLISEDHNGKNRLALRKCLNGKWNEVSLGEKKHPKRRYLFSFIGGFIFCVFLCRSGGGSSVTVIKYPPTFDNPCKPPDILEIYNTTARHNTVSISWTAPPASDSDGTVQSVVQTSGLPSGSKFVGSAAGRQHVITYKATDNDGLTAYCSFTFTVYVRVCSPAAIWPHNGYRSCDLNTQLGSVCTYYCFDGYVLIGNRTVTCQGDSTPSWTETPSCERITCNEPDILENAVISCQSKNYGAVCPIRCNTGYKLTGMTYIQCRVDGTWTPITDTRCTDSVPPDMSCITPQTFYADRGLRSTIVEWVLPIVTDNLDPNATVTQIGGQEYGSVFNLGSSVVSYRATDSEGNESGMCNIVIIVDETICQHPYDVLQDANIEFSCNSFSYSYGTECELSCRFHYSLIGISPIICERDDLSNSGATGSWSWGNGEQPYCNRTECPIFEPPINGALVRGYVGTNAIYTMQCNVNYTIPELYIGFNGQWICQNSGTFIPATPVPDCVIPRTPRTVDLPGEIFYYDGDCSDPATQAQILQNVRQIFAETVNPVIRTLCPLANNCTTGNVEITCGEVTGRKRRSSIDRNRAVPRSRQKRQNTPTLIVNFYIFTTIVKSGNQSVLQAVDETDALQSELLVPFLKELVVNGTLDQAGFSLRNDSYQSPALGNINCRTSGYKLRQSICEPCPPTYFLNTSDICEFCPIGTYSDVEGLTSCKLCPPGYTTLKIGSRNESQCKEICPAGSYSVDGVVPCAACSIGYYQNSSGSNMCFQCDTGTTELSGSNSSIQCQAFHILVNATNGKVTAGKFGTNMTNISLMFWARRFADLPTMATLMLTSDTSSRIRIEMSDKIRVSIPGTVFDETVSVLGRSVWTHVAITWDTSNGKVLVYVKGHLVINEIAITPPSFPAITNGSLELQSAGSTGVYIADLHVEDGVISSSEISSVITQCWTERINDVFNMSNFRYQALRGLDIQTPTFCDPVDDCALNPCNNHVINHTCVDGINNYTCYCVDGYTGKNCEVPPDYCVNASCLNGASCVNGINGYTCSCPSGYSGDLCDVKPVDGGWSTWSGWSGCSGRCRQEIENRTRSCDSPEPSPYGANCVGDSSESRNCSLGSCQNMECPSLERGFAMVLNCSTDQTTRMQTCKAECLTGFVRPESLGSDINFTCGSITGYNWQPMSNPPDCVDPTVPDRIEITAQINTSTPIHVEDESSYEDELLNNLSDVPCISSGLCIVTVDVVTPITESNSSVINVVLTTNLSGGAPLDLKKYLETSNASAALQKVIDSVNNLEKAASILNRSFSSLFSVKVGETTYTADSITLLEGNVVCPEGHTAADGVCAPCPDGSYYRDGICAYCEKGSYSSSNGQTSCTLCPVGVTTVTIGSYDGLQCTETIPEGSVTTTDEQILSISITESEMFSTTKAEVILTEQSPTEDTASQGELDTDKSDNMYTIVGIVTACVLLVFFVITLVIIVLRRISNARSRLVVDNSTEDTNPTFETEFINEMEVEANIKESQQNTEASETDLVNAEIVDSVLIESEASSDTSTYTNDPCQPISNQNLPVEYIYLPMDCYDKSPALDTEILNKKEIETNLNATRESHQNTEASEADLVNAEIVDSFLIEAEASKDTLTYTNNPCQSISNQDLPVEHIYLPMDCYNSTANRKEQNEEDESFVYAQIKD